MLRLYGIPVPDDDARRLVATLTADGGDLALSAARVITRGLDHQLAAIALPIGEREAILAVLEETDGALAELHHLEELAVAVLASGRSRPGPRRVSYSARSA